jgi:hypothetical protein
MMNLFRTQQNKRTQSGLRVRTAIRVGYGGGGSNLGWSGGGSHISMPSIPAAPYLPQGSGCAVPQQGYSDGFTKGFGDSPRR